VKVESPAFENHKQIPRKYTCEGENVSPPIVFRDLPRGTKSIALVMDDPDAPSGTFDHWIIWNLSPDTKTLNESSHVSNEGKNGFRKIGYGGPCPPPGKPHHYHFKAYALDKTFTDAELPKGSSKEKLEEAMQKHILGQAELVGIYQRDNG
jgi:Raf kinase inhibitor-like YbhB/YbcL family protein